MVRARRRDAERGASLVEFALVVPLLSLFLFGIVQFGIAYDMQQSVNSGAREGARRGALEVSSLAHITDRAIESYGAAAAPGDQVAVVVYDDLGNVHGARCPTGAYRSTDDCSTSPTSDSIDEDNQLLMPCGEDPDGLDGNASTPSDFIKVVVTAPYDITIPFFGVQSVTLDSEAEFRCE